MIIDEGLCSAEVIDGRGSLSCWLCEGQEEQRSLN